MTKQEILSKAYNYLKYRELITIQKDLAEKMHAAESSVSKALNGDEKTLTDNFLKRLNRAFGNIFSYQWLLTGEGDMLARKESITQTGEQNNVYGNNEQHSADSGLVKEIAAQRQLTEKAQGLAEMNGRLVEAAHELLQDTQGQISRLLSIIERMEEKGGRTEGE